MFPFWKTVIAPAIRAAGARRIVEIGALRGENTALMLEDLPADSELHVIDPVPAFDPEEHRARFGGRYVFHGDLSLNVLPSLGAFDAALIDGDHNWYTVVNELRTLRATATEAGRPLPLCFLHDVGWPYARRDLYYDPDTIPWPYRPEPSNRDAFTDLEWPIVDGVDGKPSWVQARPPLTPRQKEEIRAWQRSRMRELLGVDQLLRRCRRAIKDSGAEADTVVIFTSDNGNAVGDRRVPDTVTKNQPYDECLRVPLVVKAPGFAGTVSTACCHQDITATVLDQRVGAGGADGPSGDGVTTSERKLWRHQAEGSDRYELYDLVHDPDELVNLAAEPGRRTERDRLEARLDALLTR